MQRRERIAARKAGFTATLSERALMIKGPSLGVLYQDGMNPQRIARKRRCPSSEVTTVTALVGQTLKFGPGGRSLPGIAAKSAASASFGWVMVKRPHIRPDYAPRPAGSSIAQVKRGAGVPARRMLKMSGDLSRSLRGHCFTVIRPSVIGV